jgi:hypothetical protein
VEDRLFGLSIRDVSGSSKFTDFAQHTETRAEKIHGLPQTSITKAEKMSNITTAASVIWPQQR